MTDSAPSANPHTPLANEESHKVDVNKNTALYALYMLGGGGLGIGLITFAVASGLSSTAYDPTGALAWQAIGSLLMSGGFIALVGGMVVHGINWQIGKSAAAK